jgi:hypothetical protein
VSEPQTGSAGEARLDDVMTLPEFPRAATYPPTWALENLMGPNVLWLAESLSQVMDLRPGMRVLDMGCGKAISSIFLAKEFDVQVWATDLVDHGDGQPGADPRDGAWRTGLPDPGGGACSAVRRGVLRRDRQP